MDLYTDDTADRFTTDHDSLRAALVAGVRTRPWTDVP
jgi:hypothetical protein